MAKVSDIALLGAVVGGLYLLWNMGRDLFQAGENIAGGISQAAGAIASTPQAVNSYLNPFEYIPNLIAAQQQLQAVTAEYNELITQREEEMASRREAEQVVQKTEQAYIDQPTQANRYAYLDAYKQSYTNQLSHIKPGWKPFTIGQEVMDTAEEYLQYTLSGKGLSSEEIEYITGSGEVATPPSPAPSPPSQNVPSAGISGMPGVRYITDKKVLFSTELISKSQMEELLESSGRDPTQFKWVSNNEAYWWFT